MMKLLVGMFTAALLALGLAGGFSSPAQADVECPYTGCVKTRTHANGPAEIDRRTRPTIRVRVVARSGNARPVGMIRIACRKPGVTKARTYSYDGPKSVLGPKLGGPARWTCTVKFRSTYKFKASKDVIRIKTVR